MVTHSSIMYVHFILWYWGYRYIFQLISLFLYLSLSGLTDFLCFCLWPTDCSSMLSATLLITKLLDNEINSELFSIHCLWTFVFLLIQPSFWTSASCRHKFNIHCPSHFSQSMWLFTVKTKIFTKLTAYLYFHKKKKRSI